MITQAEYYRIKKCVADGVPAHTCRLTLPGEYSVPLCVVNGHGNTEAESIADLITNSRNAAVRLVKFRRRLVCKFSLRTRLWHLITDSRVSLIAAGYFISDGFQCLGRAMQIGNEGHPLVMLSLAAALFTLAIFDIKTGWRNLWEA